MLNKSVEDDVRNIVREELHHHEMEKKGHVPTRHGEEWTQQEENHLIGELKASIFMTAGFHRRTPVSIAFKLFKLWREGKFDDFRFHRTWTREEE